MKAKALVSTPLNPLAKAMRALSARCEEFIVASAFVSDDAVSDLVEVAIANKASVSVLTGTYSNSTRKRTFKRLFGLHDSGKISARIWSCGAHQNFHAKLYVWRLKQGRAVAWIGSANFTEGGLQNEGELMLQLGGRWGDDPIVALRDSFAAEWNRGVPISKAFLDSYAEAKRTAPGHGLSRLKLKRRTFKRPVEGRGPRYFTANAATNVAEGTKTYELVERLLGSADAWLHYWAKGLGKIRRGDLCIFFDLPDNDVALVEVTDFARAGKACMFSYVPVLTRSPWVPWTATLRKRITRATGLKGRGRSLGYRWLSKERAHAILKEIYPTRRNLPV